MRLVDEVLGTTCPPGCTSIGGICYVASPCGSPPCRPGCGEYAGACWDVHSPCGSPVPICPPGCYWSVVTQSCVRGSELEPCTGPPPPAGGCDQCIMDPGSGRCIDQRTGADCSACFLGCPPPSGTTPPPIPPPGICPSGCTYYPDLGQCYDAQMNPCAPPSPVPAPFPTPEPGETCPGDVPANCCQRCQGQGVLWGTCLSLCQATQTISETNIRETGRRVAIVAGVGLLGIALLLAGVILLGRQQLIRVGAGTTRELMGNLVSD